MDNPTATIILRLVFLVVLFLPLIPWPSPYYAKDLVARESVLPNVFLLILAALIAFYSYCWYKKEPEVVVFKDLYQTFWTDSSHQ